MKKAISFVLAALMLVSAVPTALATNDYTQGTQVVYTATGSESYTITVPAQLAPGGNGTVTLQGTWADNRIITVTAEPTVTLTNSIKAEDQKVLNVHFDGISEAGSNIGSQTFTEGVSVDDITNALFGTWSGKFNYNVDVTDTFATETASGSYVFVNDVSPSQHDLTVNLSSDTITDFSSVKVTRYGSNLIDVSAMLNECFTSNNDGTYTLTALETSSAARKSDFANVYIPANTPFYLSTQIVENNTAKEVVIFAEAILEDGTSKIIQAGRTWNDAYGPYTYSQAVEQIRLFFRQTPSSEEPYVVPGDSMTIKELKLNIGEEREYAEFTQPQTVLANSDGSVTGLSSISPEMTLLADTDGVTITCDYKKKQ